MGMQPCFNGQLFQRGSSNEHDNGSLEKYVRRANLSI